MNDRQALLDQLLSAMDNADKLSRSINDISGFEKCDIELLDELNMILIRALHVCKKIRHNALSKIEGGE